MTLTVPSSAKIPIGVGGMDQKSGILYLDSGRGNTIASVVKPDFVAPAVGVQAIGRLGNYVTLTGTSAASAIAAGACAQIMEWGKQPWEKTAFKFGADRKYSDPRVRKEPGCILSEYRLGLWKNECLRCTDEILWGIKFIYKA